MLAGSAKAVEFVRNNTSKLLRISAIMKHEQESKNDQTFRKSCMLAGSAKAAEFVRNNTSKLLRISAIMKHEQESKNGGGSRPSSSQTGPGSQWRRAGPDKSNINNLFQQKTRETYDWLIYEKKNMVQMSSPNLNDEFATCLRTLVLFVNYAYSPVKENAYQALINISTWYS